MRKEAAPYYLYINNSFKYNQFFTFFYFIDFKTIRHITLFNFNLNPSLQLPLESGKRSVGHFVGFFIVLPGFFLSFLFYNNIRPYENIFL
jgi:hypothetical protein